jgi:MFS family permease
MSKGSLPATAAAHLHIHHAVDNAHFGWRHLRLWLLSAGGLMMGGYTFFMIGVVLPLMQVSRNFTVEAWEIGAIAAAGLLGRMLGALIFGGLVDRHGRKTMYRLDPLIIAAFGAASAFAPNALWLIVFQVFVGMGVGGDYPICQAYVSEAMPARVRSRMVAGVIACQALGELLAAGIGFSLLYQHPEISEWRDIALSVVPLSVVLFLLRFSIPESPKWLAEQGRIDDARQAMRKLLGPDIDLTIPAQAPVHDAVHVSWRDLFAPGTRRATILTSVPWMMQDVAVYGIGIFTPTILLGLHLHEAMTGIGTPAIAERLGAIRGSAMVDGFLVAGFLLGIALMGRVSLLKMQIFGFICMAVGLALVATGSAMHDNLPLIVIGFILFNTMLNAGPNLTTYTMPSEVVPVRLRATAHGFATSIGKLGATLATLAFPWFIAHIGMVTTLVIVAGLALMGAAVTYFFRVAPLDAGTGVSRTAAD